MKRDERVGVTNEMHMNAELHPLVQGVNPGNARGSWIRRAITGSLNAFLAAVALSSCGAAPRVRPLEEVVVTGRGTSAAAALDDARVVALEKVVGALVDARTRVVNADAIESITSASTAFIKSLETLESGATADGGAYVTARAFVRAEQLKARLVEARLASGAFSGESLLARGLSMAANEDAAVRFLCKNTRDFPACLMKVRPVGELELLDRTGKVWTVGLRVEVSLDAERWEEFSKTVRAALEVVAIDKWRWRPARHLSLRGWSMDALADMPKRVPTYIDRGNKTLWARLDQGFYGPQYGHWPLLAGTSRDGRKLSWGFECVNGLADDEAIVMMPEDSAWTANVQSYIVPRALLAAFGDLEAKTTTLRVRLRDRDGATLEEASIDMSVGPTAMPSSRWRAWRGGFNPWQECRSAPGWLNVQQATRARGPIGPGEFGMPGISASFESVFYMPQGLQVMPGSWRTAYCTKSATLKLAFEADPALIGQISDVELQLASVEGSCEYVHEPRHRRR